MRATLIVRFLSLFSAVLVFLACAETPADPPSTPEARLRSDAGFADAAAPDAAAADASAPLDPEIHLETVGRTVDENATTVLRDLEQREVL